MKLILVMLMMIVIGPPSATRAAQPDPQMSIFVLCSERWPTDGRGRTFCIKTQVDALNEIRRLSKPKGSPRFNIVITCGQEWSTFNVILLTDWVNALNCVRNRLETRYILNGSM